MGNQPTGSHNRFLPLNAPDPEINRITLSKSVFSMKKSLSIQSFFHDLLHRKLIIFLSKFQLFLESSGLVTPPGRFRIQGILR